MRGVKEIKLTDKEDRERLRKTAQEALQKFAQDLNPELGEWRRAVRILKGRCYKADLAWLFEVSERTVDAWGIQPNQKSPGRKNLYDVNEVFSQLK